MPLARLALTVAATAGALSAGIPTPAIAPSSAVHATSPRTVDSSLVVSTAWLAAHLDDPSVVVLHVGHDDSYADGHVPGARALSYMDVVARNAEGIGTELPSVEVLRAQFERLGVSDSTRVVVYAPEAPMATRILFTLDYLGHRKFALLDGGLQQWKAEGRPVSRAVPVPVPGHMTPHPRPDLVATASWITEHAGRGIALIDTRTDGEYVGAGERHGMPSAGHIAGARQLQWEQLFRDDTIPLLEDRAALERLYAERVKEGDTVVTYCWVGYRASATWFVARYLGYPVKLYDGSYQDWSKRNLAVRAGDTP